MKLLTVANVAEILSISKSLVYGLVDKGEMPYIAVGQSKAIRFAPEDIEAFIRSRKVQNEGSKPNAPRPRLKHIKP